MGTTKTATRSALLQKLAELQAEIAALSQSESSVNSEAVASLTASDWGRIRLNMVEHDRNNKPLLRKDGNGYLLTKGADVKDYMFVKGFEATLISRAKKGEPVKLGTTVAEKSGHSQLMYACEVIERLIAKGFVKADRFTKVKKSRKSSK